jgi:hypothetical protein
MRMKKLLLLITIIGCTFFSSCEDNPTDALTQIPIAQNKFLKANINGTPIVFDETEVVKQLVNEAGLEYTDLYITANKKDDTSAKIIFKVEYMMTGTETCYYFLYNEGEREYDIETGNSFHVNVSAVSENHLKGSFSGTLKDFEGNEVTITNGDFDIAF